MPKRDAPGQWEKKMPKRCKYEGKRTDARINVALVLTLGACALACSFGEFLVFFILGW
jgi:hypothetical protein